MLALAVVAVGLVIYVWLQRQRELFVLSVRDGRVLLSDFKAALAKVPSATIRVVKEDTAARLTGSGIDELVEQRLRNILRLYPLSSLRASTAPERTFLTRMLGIAWLAWIFDARD